MHSLIYRETYFKHVNISEKCIARRTVFWQMSKIKSNISHRFVTGHYIGQVTGFSINAFSS